MARAMAARSPEPAKRWVHRGATSQDILDTALMLVARDALAVLREDLGGGYAAIRRPGGAPLRIGGWALGRTLTLSDHALRRADRIAGVGLPAQHLQDEMPR